MSTSKVYFTNLRANPKYNLQDKLKELIKRAGISEINFENKLTAIKIHFGEPGNLAFIRPNFAATVVRMITERGGSPFLTDTNTLYHGRRSNAVDHIEAAHENGFNPMVVGCPVIIADGLRGADFEEVEIDEEYCKTAKIGKGITDADVIISMNHFKGHEMTGYGGALKNLGMGCASVGGKLELHSTSAPQIIEENCTGCNVCVKNCAHDAISLNNSKIATIDENKCVGCGQCVAVCQYDSAQVVWNGASKLVCCKIAEYTKAVIDSKPHFHINFIMSISPNCDCWGFNDAPLVADIGIAASFDPVALDQASVDMVKNAPIIPGNQLSEKGHSHHHAGEDKFTMVHPNTDWEAGIEHAVNIGLGSRQYELVNILSGK